MSLQKKKRKPTFKQTTVNKTQQINIMTEQLKPTENGSDLRFFLNSKHFVP